MISNRGTTVSELVERMLRVGDLKTGVTHNEVLFDRAQKDFEHIRENDFTFCVPVTHTIKNDLFSYPICGVINGLCESNNVLSIETIEFTNESGHSFVPELDIIAWSKAKLLAYMILDEKSYNEITIQINWYHKNSFILLNHVQFLQKKN